MDVCTEMDGGTLMVGDIEVLHGPAGFLHNKASPSCSLLKCPP